MKSQVPHLESGDSYSDLGQSTSHSNYQQMMTRGECSQMSQPPSLRLLHLRGGVVGEQNEQLQEAAQDIAVLLFNPNYIWQRKWLFPTDASVSFCGPGKESKLQKIFDHNSGLRREGERGKVIANNRMTTHKHMCMHTHP